jgi:hypothetical protein
MPTIKICIERELPVPAARVWAFLGEGFGSWESWATPFESCSLDSAMGKGCIRTCKFKGQPGTVVQEVLAYDPDTFVLEYSKRYSRTGRGQLVDIRFMNSEAPDRCSWQLVPMGENQCKVVGNADFIVARYMTPVYYPVKWKLAGKLDEFQDYIEKESKRTLMKYWNVNLVGVKM